METEHRASGGRALLGRDYWLVLSAPADSTSGAGTSRTSTPPRVSRTCFTCPLARPIFSNHPRGAGQPPGDRRTHGTLQIDAQIVALSPQRVTQSRELAQRLSPQRSASPFFGFYQVRAIHQRHLAAISTEKSVPARLDRPTQIPLWMGPAQSSNRRQGMQNIAHRAQPHNQDAGLFILL